MVVQLRVLFLATALLCALPAGVSAKKKRKDANYVKPPDSKEPTKKKAPATEAQKVLKSKAHAEAVVEANKQ